MSGAVPLPDGEQVRREVQAMVDLGPRLTGSPAHDAFCSWIAEELVAAGLQLGPSDVYDYDRYATGDVGLEYVDPSTTEP